MCVAPVEREDMNAQVRFWSASRAGFDMSPAFEWAVNTGYPVALSAADLLGDAIEAIQADAATRPLSALRADVELVIRRSGTLHGIGGWTAARLSSGVTLTNSPLAPDRIKRRNVFLPLRVPVPVTSGDRLHLKLAILPDHHIVNWTIAGSAGRGVARQAHSTLSGMLASREDLKRADPDFVPVLTPRGAGRLTILQLCDGTRTLREVEDLVLARHADLFTTRGEAAAFVAEVVSGYTRIQ
jgi:hypothetical protein